MSSSDEIKLSAVCFISDTSECNDNQFGGLDDPDYELDDEERCFNEGYTVTDCPDGYKPGGKKCPYGDKYFCACPMNYKFSCTGANQTGGMGEACNGKYAECTCAEGYAWKVGVCARNKAEWGECSGYAANCALGDILFSDGTCSANMVLGKTPIAIVIYKSDDGRCGQAMALNSLKYYEWSNEGTDTSSLPNLSISQASTDYASCENSKKIMAAGNKGSYPAAWAANEYSTEGTRAGDWCLPAAGIFTSYYNNSIGINRGFTKVGGKEITVNVNIWSSTKSGENRAWYSYFRNNYGLYSNTYMSSSFEVRPVIEF